MPAGAPRQREPMGVVKAALGMAGHGSRDMRRTILGLALIVLGASPVPAEVRVLRGSIPAAPPAGSPPPTSAGEAQLLAGSRLWLVDQAAGQVLACRQLKTSSVNGWQIRCTEGRIDARYGF
jgi:hypothetical protein